MAMNQDLLTLVDELDGFLESGEEVLAGNVIETEVEVGEFAREFLFKAIASSENVGNTSFFEELLAVCSFTV